MAVGFWLYPKKLTSIYKFNKFNGILSTILSVAGFYLAVVVDKQEVREMTLEIFLGLTF